MGRWTNLIRVGAEMPSWVPRPHKVRRLAAEIERRTGFRAWIDTRRDCLVFGYERDGEEFTVWDVRLFKDDRRMTGSDFGEGALSADALCRALNMVRVDPREKWKWHEQNTATAQRDNERAAEEQTGVMADGVMRKATTPIANKVYA